MKNIIKKFKYSLSRLIYAVGFPVIFGVLYKTTRVRVIVIQNDRILLVKSWLGNGKWELPGGGVDIRDTPPQSAIRELHEELGLDLDKNSLKELDALITKDVFKIKSHYFAVKLPAGEKTEIILGKEILEYKWFKLNRLKNLSLHANTRDVLDAQNMLK